MTDENFIAGLNREAVLERRVDPGSRLLAPADELSPVSIGFVERFSPANDYGCGPTSPTQKMG